MKSQNVGDLDRIIRIVGGIVLAILGLLMLFTPSVVGGIVLLVLGIYFVVTGFIRYCPLYSVLKLSTKK